MEISLVAKPEVTKIDLGNDGTGDVTLEYKELFNLPYYGRWYFCRNGEEVRAIDSRYLEQKLIDKIVSLQSR